MSPVLAKVINMSIDGGILILAVILIRLLFKKLPRKIFIIAWILVMIRLVFPFSVNNSLSPLPDDFFHGSTQVPAASDVYEWPGIDPRQTVTPVDKDQTAPAESASAQSMEKALLILWIMGIAAVLAAAGIKTVRLRRIVKDAMLYKDNVYLSPGIRNSFVLGIIRPVIYISSDVSKEYHGYIIDHEKEHIKHGDNILKLLFYVITAVHWFNPLCLIAYHLFSEDLEMACDERTTSSRDAQYRASYTQALLYCGIYSSALGTGTLSFGSSNVKKRIERIMDIKKTRVITIVSFVAVCVALVFFLMTNNAAAAENNKSSEDSDGYVSGEYPFDGRHEVIMDAEGNIVEVIDVEDKGQLDRPAPEPELPDYAPVSPGDLEKYESLLKIRGEVIKEGFISCPAEYGEPFFAVCEGEVISSQYERIYGNCVTVKDDAGRIWKYEHCSKLVAKEGDHVSAGDLIAYIGTSGQTAEPVLMIRIVK